MKLKTLFTVAVAAILVSCTNEPSVNQRLQGSWNLTNVYCTGWTHDYGDPHQFVIFESVIDSVSGIDLLDGAVNYKYVYGASYQTDYELVKVTVRDSLAIGSWHHVDLSTTQHNDSIYIDNGNWIDGYQILSFNGNELLIRGERLIYTPQLGHLQVIEQLRFTKQ